MTDLDVVRLRDIAVFAARAAGDVVRRAYDSPPDAEWKGLGDWVSEVDHRCEEIIREILTTADPSLEFLGEEGGGTRDRPGWIVDPVDGTTNFLRRHPAVGISIALVDAKRPLLGIVHAPLLDETFTAIRGRGAYRDGVPIGVSDRPVERAICATGFPFRKHQRDRLLEYRPVLDAALEVFEDLRRVGAASLDLAWTASGTFDGYFELGLGPWDLAAGVLLVEEAGGVATDWTGDADGWLDSGDIVVGNVAVHERILALIRC
jgi:myo-inositol-1(or 4)-monophosphatase